MKAALAVTEFDAISVLQPLPRIDRAAGIEMAFASLVVCIALALLFFNYYPTDSVNFRLLTDIVFLNVTHNALTYFMLTRLPEMKAWIFAVSEGKPRRFWWKVAGVNFALVLFFFVTFRFVLENKIYNAVLILIHSLIPLHHGFAQSRGLSFVLSRNIATDSTVPQRKKLAAHERREKWAYGMCYVATCVFLNVNLLALFPGIFSAHWIGVAWGLCWKISLCASFLLMLNALTFPFAGKLYKFIFLTRTLLWPLCGRSLIASYGTSLVHGVEYGFVTNRMVKASVAPMRWTYLLALVLPVIAAAWFRDLFWVKHSFGSEFNLDCWTFITALSTAGSFSHYYLDRQIFRMRSEASRRYCSPLLLPKG